MSSTQEAYPDTSSDTSPGVARSQSPMSSTAINITPHAYGSLEAMPRSYNEWAPDQHYHRQPGTAAMETARPPGSRLPPPESLVAGIPSGIGPSHNRYPQSSTTSTVLQQGRVMSSLPPQVPPMSASALQPPGAPYSDPNLVHNQPRRQVPDQGGPSAPPSSSSSTFAGRMEAPQESRAPHPPQRRPFPQSHHPILRPRQRPLEPNVPSDERQRRAQLLEAASQPPQLPMNPAALKMVPNLMAEHREPILSDISLRLTMRQQPQAARACGFGDRDRRVIDPPPIVQLIIECPGMTAEESQLYLRYESYVMNCSICDETGTRDQSYMPEEYQHQRRLMGSLVGTPFVGQDENGQEGCFFCFSDLSCRTPGAFRLKFTLIMIVPSQARKIRHFPVLTETYSGIFHVYSAKEFPGMMPSSNLAKRLKEQGCIISIKKGNERSRNARNQGEGSDNGDETRQPGQN